MAINKGDQWAEQEVQPLKITPTRTGTVVTFRLCHYDSASSIPAKTAYFLM